jgi:hypothetical protein
MFVKLILGIKSYRRKDKTFFNTLIYLAVFYMVLIFLMFFCIILCRINIPTNMVLLISVTGLLAVTYFFFV